jgi:hypothetical protein
VDDGVDADRAALADAGARGSSTPASAEAAGGSRCATA